MKFRNWFILTLFVLIAGLLLVRSVHVKAAESHAVLQTYNLFLPNISRSGEQTWNSATGLIRAATGGSISLGNSTLSVPPGALNTDTTVTISSPKGVPDAGDRGLGFVKLEPLGLSFNIPATLAMTYNQPMTFEEEFLNAYIYSSSNRAWEPLPVISRNTTSNNVVVQVPHFSIITTIFDRPLDIVPYLEGKYLKKGDALFTMTKWCFASWCEDKFTWFIGHAGLYLGVTNALDNTNNGQTIVESTPGTFRQRSGCDDGGVRYGTLSQDSNSFMNSADHLYMGARRLIGLSDEDRTQIATYAKSKDDRGYSVVGEGNLGDNCYSCVGLVEAAYDSTVPQHSIIPGPLEVPFILPIEQFIRTEPVNEITVRVGNLVNFDIYRVYQDPVLSQGKKFPAYSKDSNVVISGCPTAANCPNGHITWTPQSTDIGTKVLTFQASQTLDGKTYYSSQTFTIHVLSTGNGTVTGKVVDATTASGLAGANVLLSTVGLTANTDSAGNYTISNVPAGTYTITAQKGGYVSISTDLTVEENQTTISNIALPTAAFPSDIVMTLTWGASPADLDSHLWLPASNPFHIYYGSTGSLTANPYAQLDVDDTSAYGPENVTIRQQYNGTYTYAVYNYSGSPNITTSAARVVLIKNQIPMQTFSVPTAGTGRWWYVFDYDSITGNIIPRNLITDASPRLPSASFPEMIKKKPK